MDLCFDAKPKPICEGISRLWISAHTPTLLIVCPSFTQRVYKMQRARVTEMHTLHSVPLVIKYDTFISSHHSMVLVIKTNCLVYCMYILNSIYFFIIFHCTMSCKCNYFPMNFVINICLTGYSYLYNSWI